MELAIQKDCRCGLDHIFHKLWTKYDIEFYQNKFPDGLKNLPGFSDYINYVVESKKNITPLQELESLQKIHELQIKEENNNIE